MIGVYFKGLIHTLPLFLKGLWVTIMVSGISLVAGTLLGVICGILRTVKQWGLSKLMGAYADYMRGVPFLVHIFIIYFILPEVGIQLEPFPAAAIALTVYAGAYISEIVAAGILSVPRGQREAATAYGLNAWQRMRYIIFPQAVRVILPPLVGEYVLLVKDSSIVSVIGLTDVTRVGWLTVQRIPEGLMVFGLVGILYFVVCYPLIHLSHYLEEKVSYESH
ncbi:MAG: amino acid ABC transporter permease [Deltaproteobacteria bacterium]|nr:amino acid ABC transporter permease [Deltaproteobacteria bacterium]MBW2071487.1 amino acid ABC transporter permease [Deltaproteobacteria bacterium]